MKKYKLALLGSPVAHSKSPFIQKRLARICSISLSYDKIEATEDTLADIVEQLKKDGYDGFNCTMPTKTAMAYMADDISDEAKELHAVNTVAIRDGQLVCDITDGKGLVMALLANGAEIKGNNVLVLGAGGAARAAVLEIAKKMPKSLVVLNRSIDKAKQLQAVVLELCGYNINYDILTDENLSKYAHGCDIVVNTTSLGMKGKDKLESFTFLSGMNYRGYVLDAVYNPLETELLKKAKTFGLTALDGLWMLLCQGVLAFEMWTGEKVPLNEISKIHGEIAQMEIKKIIIINGPNLNLLGEREPGIYGELSLDKINEEISEKAQALGYECEFFQSNHEGAIIDKLHEVRKYAHAVILNAGAYTHYSYAIRDAIAAIRIPVYEVHLSDIMKREEFRHTSVIKEVCKKQISGHGKDSYIMALDEISKL